MTMRPENTLADMFSECAGNTTMQVRAALAGLLLSVALESVLPLFGAALVVAVVAAYTNGIIEDNASEGAA